MKLYWGDHVRIRIVKVDLDPERELPRGCYFFNTKREAREFLKECVDNRLHNARTCYMSALRDQKLLASLD